MEELVQQVRILAETVQAMTQRQEQLSKMQEETSKVLLQTVAELKDRLEAFEVTNEALTRSLAESDSQIDDLAKVTAALLQLQQSQSEENAA